MSNASMIAASAASFVPRFRATPSARAVRRALAALLPLAVLAAPHAHAASNVTLYGLIDSGAEFLTSAAREASGSKDNVVRATSGNMSGSRWGLKGNEDLGGGTQALFLLENGFDITSGKSLQGSREFGRLAYMGLSNKTYGRFTLGRQGGIFLDWVSKYNPLGNAVYAVKMQDPVFSDRLDNTARYENAFGPFHVLAQYSKGYDDVSFGTSTAGDNRRAQVIEGGVEYRGGPFSAVLAYDQKNGGSTALNAASTAKVGGYEGNVNRSVALAAKYKFAKVDVSGGWRYRDGRATHLTTLTTEATEISNFYWLGATYKYTPSLWLSATAMYQDFKDTNRDPWSFQISSDYFLSKRTDVYVNVGYVLNRHGSNLGLNGFGTDVVAGSNQFGTMVGIRHRF
ncbi:porin [Robbsia sp. KACC 23696]|uniref:porin n=1 Tax=Robbsia sp. KACC 23696 TaxID=3149231 RepID=UPI00325B1CEF